jgi:hypothetical protein
LRPLFEPVGHPPIEIPPPDELPPPMDWRMAPRVDNRKPCNALPLWP